MTEETNKDELVERLRTLTAQVDEAIESVKNDRIADMTAFEDKVSDLCNDIHGAAPGTAEAIYAPMAQMIGRLEVLASELHAFQERKDKDVRAK